MLRSFLIIMIFLSFFSNSWAGKNESKSTISLSDAIEHAINNNFSIKEVEESKKAALEAIKSAKTDFFAKAFANYTYTKLEDQPYQIISGFKRPAGYNNSHHWDFTLMQILFKGFAITTRYDIAKIEAEIKKLEKEQVILNVKRDVKTAYFEALLSKKIYMVSEENVKALKAHENEAQNFFDHGIIPLNDLLKSKVALANVIYEKEKAKAVTQIALARLNIIMGMDMNADIEPCEIQKINAVSYALNLLTEEAMKNRPVLKSFRLGIKNIESSVKLVKSAYYPSISLVGRYEENGADFSSKNNDYTNDHNASISIQAAWTFFEWGKTNADVSKQRFDKQSLTEKMKGVENQIKLEIKVASLDLNVAENNIKTAEEALKQAKENWRITNLQYSQHITKSTEVLDSRTFLSQSETNYYKALYGYMIALAKLEGAAGMEF